MTNRDILTFCNNVALLREKNGIDKKEMANICGISVDELAQIEQGSLPKTLSVEIAVRLYQHFDISVEKLFRPLSE